MQIWERNGDVRTLMAAELCETCKVRCRAAAVQNWSSLFLVAEPKWGQDFTRGGSGLGGERTTGVEVATRGVSGVTQFTDLV